MTQPRTTRRVLAAALSVGALLVTAACSSGTAASPAGSAPASASGANWNEFGPIVYAQGKDTSGNSEVRDRRVECGQPEREGRVPGAFR